MEKVREVVARIRYIASDVPEIPITLYDEAHRIEAYQEIDGRSVDTLEGLRDACIETANNIGEILKIMGEQLNGGRR